MNKVSVFNFKSNPVRSIAKDGEPWFVASDVCAALELLNVSMAVARLDDDEKSDISIVDTSSNGVTQARNTLTINESGLYSLILTSRKEEAKVFKKWVTSEVLPSIRKTGQYAVTLSPMEMVIQSAQAIMRIEAAQAEQDAKLAAMSARLDNLNGDTGYRTVTAFLRNEGIKKSLKDANLFGRNCTKLCLEVGLTIGNVPDERFGSVHSYPVEVLREVLEGTK